MARAKKSPHETPLPRAGGAGTSTSGRAVRRAAEAADRARSLSFPVGWIAARLAVAPQPARRRAAFARRPPTSSGRESIDGQGQQQPEERQEEQEAEAGKAQGRAEEVIAAARRLAPGRRWIGWTRATDGLGPPSANATAGVPARGAGRRRQVGRRPSPAGMTRGLYPGSWNETHSEVALPWLCSARTATRIVEPGARPAIRTVVFGAVTPATFRAARPVHRNTE